MNRFVHWVILVALGAVTLGVLSPATFGIGVVEAIGGALPWALLTSLCILHVPPAELSVVRSSTFAMLAGDALIVWGGAQNPLPLAAAGLFFACAIGVSKEKIA